jgi:hypothetical protein
MSDIDVILTIEADVNDGGWRMSGQVFNDADSLDFYQAIEAWFDLHVGGWEALPRPAFRGHLLPEPWSKTFQTSIAPLNAFTAQEFMKRGEIQGIFFTDNPYPANQHQITDMTLADIVSHIVGQAGEYGHCNLVKDCWPEGIITTDIDFINSTEIDSYEVKQGNFWQRLQEIAEIDFYYMWFSKANIFNFKPHPMFDVTLPNPVFELDDEWLAEPLEIETRNTEQVGQIKLSGTTPAGLQITGRYPTDPEPGPIIERSNYLGTADTLMDIIAGRMYEFENRSHTVTAQIGNGVGLLIDLMDRISITYASTVDGIDWSEKMFWVHKINVDITANFTAKTTLKLEAENSLDIGS